MTAPVSNIPVSVNYTGRDYYSIRQQLIARVQDRIPTWLGTDPADFGLALIEAFAYMGDLISYYVDRNANENSIYTATQRNSILNIAQIYGYVPAGYRQAYVNVTFTNTSENDITLPAGTVVSGQVTQNDAVFTVYFTTLADSLVPATSSYTVTATEGRMVTLVASNTDPTYGELIGTSDGTPNMTFALGETPVVDGTVVIYVQDGDIYSKWNQVQHIIDYGPLDQVYLLSNDENNNVFITFGDGVSGYIPVAYSQVRALYTVGGGIIGNITTNILDTLVYVPGLTQTQTTALQSVITLTNNTVAFGGNDPESNDQIRQGAPKALTASNRAVTLNDFESLARTVSNVGKANAIASTWTSVTLYIAPTRNDNDPDLNPGLDALGNPTAEYGAIHDSTAAFMADKIMIGTTLTIQPPAYQDLVMTILYTKQPQYTTAETELALKQKLLAAYGYNGMDFQQTITPQNIEYVLNQIPQVQTVKLTQLYLYAGTPGLGTVTGNANQIFRFQESNINLGSS